jgi:hypothetical protein
MFFMWSLFGGVMHTTRLISTFNIGIGRGRALTRRTPSTYNLPNIEYKIEKRNKKKEKRLISTYPTDWPVACGGPSRVVS